MIPHGMPVQRAILLFAGIDSFIAAAYLSAVACAVACAVAALLAWLRQPAMARSLQRVTGLCMAGLGIRTALERA